MLMILENADCCRIDEVKFSSILRATDSFEYFLCRTKSIKNSFPFGQSYSFQSWSQNASLKMKILLVIPFIFVLLAVGAKSQDHETIPGGVSSYDRPADDQVRQLIQDIHPKIKKHLLGLPGGKNIQGDIEPVSYRTQLVNGVNYFVKVRATTPNKTVYYHLKIYKSFNDTHGRLIKAEGPKKEQDSITYF